MSCCCMICASRSLKPYFKPARMMRHAEEREGTDKETRSTRFFCFDPGFVML